jgi:hypothetical protein
MDRQSSTQKVRRVPAPHGGNLTKDQFEARKTAELASVEGSLSEFRYPIENRDQLHTAISKTSAPLYFRGRRIDAKQLIGQLPDSIFPLKSANHFARQLEPHLKNLAVAVKMAPLRHPPRSSKG